MPTHCKRCERALDTCYYVKCEFLCYGCYKHIRDYKRSKSDGYHTFNELYRHRTYLYAALTNVYPAWKSWHRADGSMYTDMFIVGMDTPLGPITYHIYSYYWNMFNIKQLERAPAWDRYTSDDVLTRLASLLKEA